MRPRRTTLVLAALGAATVMAPLPVQAVGGCVGRYEYDETHRGMSVAQVANWYDTYGDRILDGDGVFRRDYRTCWAPDERRVIVEFSVDTGDTVDWYVRDGVGG